MKIEINIDIEQIVREEIRSYIKDNLVINNVAKEVSVTDEVSVSVAPVELEVPEVVTATTVVDDGWEYGPNQFKRRSPLKKALHAKELELNRNLTVEEKATVEATLDIIKDKVTKVKEKIKKKAHIEELIDSVKEEEEEANVSSMKAVLESDSVVHVHVGDNKDTEVNTPFLTEQKEEEEVSGKVPKTDPLGITQSMFNQ